MQHARSHERETFLASAQPRIAAAIAPRSPDEGEHWRIVVIDTCSSAAFVQQVSAAVDAIPGGRQFLPIGTSSDGATNLGRFTAALRSVLRHNFGASDRITLWDLARELRRTLPRAEVVPEKFADEIRPQTMLKLIQRFQNHAEERSIASFAAKYLNSRTAEASPQDHEALSSLREIAD